MAPYIHYGRGPPAHLVQNFILLTEAHRRRRRVLSPELYFTDRPLKHYSEPYLTYLSPELYLTRTMIYYEDINYY
jgi:hypothetical protein